MYPRAYASFTLLERLAQGGMSEVDLARRAVDDSAFVRFLVVKRIRASHTEDASFVRMFKDEARITSELRHSHIAQLYDFGRAGDEYYLALEYVAGLDLRAVLALLHKRRQRMPVRMALRVAWDLLDALSYAHTRTDVLGKPMEIVHRDVNPRNIMISLEGEVKLIDFGVARAADRLERTKTDHYKGKLAYMAPEQIRGRDIDPKVDLFSLGLTLYEMLMGTSPFAGLEQTQILYRILNGKVPAPEVPREWGKAGRELVEVVEKALRHDRSERYADAQAMRQAIGAVAETFGGMPEPAELAAWLREVDPALEPRLRDKVRQWSGPLPDLPPTTETDISLDVLEAELTAAGPLPTQEPGAAGLRPSMLVAAGVTGVTLVLAAVVVAVAVVVGVLLWSGLQGAAPPVP